MTIPFTVIFLIQTVMPFIGSEIDGDVDIDVDGDGDLDGGAGFQFFTIKNFLEGNTP